MQGAPQDLEEPKNDSAPPVALPNSTQSGQDDDPSAAWDEVGQGGTGWETATVRFRPITEAADKRLMRPTTETADASTASWVPSEEQSLDSAGTQWQVPVSACLRVVMMPCLQS